MAYPPVIVVDKEDNETGLAMLAEVWVKGLYHRVARIMVEDGRGNILLQKRSDNMIILPGRWETSAAGHVDKGMTYHAAALQETAEELGIQPVGLAEIGSLLSRAEYDGRIMNQFSKVYRVRFDGTVTTMDEHEVAGFEWFSIEDAKRMVAEHPDKVTFGLRDVLTKLY